MKQGLFTVLENRALNARFSYLRLGGDCSAFTFPGQFVSLALPGFFLRRPFSVCDWEDDRFSLLYEAVGRGTEQMRTLQPGSELDVLTGLGNGFTLSDAGDTPLLVGGGSGVSPLCGLARRLVENGITPRVILGFNTKDDIVLPDAFTALGLSPLVTTVDGSLGIPGFVTDAMTVPHSSFYTCGPEKMMKAVAEKSPVSGQLSFDARMGCGFGACMGCTRKTLSGPKRVCKDGPVFRKEEILWDD